MKEKIAAWLPIGVFLCLLAAISAWEFTAPGTCFSENENRTLAQFPKLEHRNTAQRGFFGKL